jgi:translin
MASFSFDVDDIESIFQSQHSAREAMLVSSRKVIQLSSASIRATHREEHDKARELNVQSAELLAECEAQIGEFPDIAANSLFYDAQKEYTESLVTAAVIKGEQVPTRHDLGVTAAAYINGVVEAASELRRCVLDLLRDDKLDRASELLDVMDEVYSIAITIDYPDALTHGLRRTTDAFRAVLERTRADVTTATIFSRARN